MNYITPFGMPWYVKQRAYLPVVFQRIHELYGLVYCPIDRLEQVFVRDESELVVKFKKVD